MAKKQTTAAKQESAGETVTIEIPVAAFSSGVGYQVSPGSPPMQLRYRRLTRRQGIALSRVRLGMVRDGDCLGAEPGRPMSREVSSKEDVIARILEIAADAIAEAEGATEAR